MDQKEKCKKTQQPPDIIILTENSQVELFLAMEQHENDRLGLEDA